MWRVFDWALGWIFRGVVIKFVLFTALKLLMGVLVPMAAGYITNFISPGTLTAAFNSIPAGVWYFLDAFRIDIGAPLVISAYLNRFLIRRLPVIG